MPGGDIGGGKKRNAQVNQIGIMIMAFLCKQLWGASFCGGLKYVS